MTESPEQDNAGQRRGSKPIGRILDHPAIFVHATDAGGMLLTLRLASIGMIRPDFGPLRVRS
jgi:hypothetical protein